MSGKHAICVNASRQTSSERQQRTDDDDTTTVGLGVRLVAMSRLLGRVRALIRIHTHDTRVYRAPRLPTSERVWIGARGVGSSGASSPAPPARMAVARRAKSGRLHGQMAVGQASGVGVFTTP